MAPCCTKVKSTTIYHEFKPFCEWKRGEDLLIVHVPEFKKEQLRLQVDTSGVLKISGERPLGGDKAAMRSRFYKETRVPQQCNIDGVRAQLYDGKLTIIMPTKCLQEEMIRFGNMEFAKKKVLNIGFGAIAITAIAGLLFFKPRTPA